MPDNSSLDSRQQALNALPPGACRLLVQVTDVDVLDRAAGTWRTITIPEFDTRRQAVLLTLLMRKMERGMDEVGVPRQRWAHADPCRSCERRALPGPSVFGLWLVQDWHADQVSHYAAGQWRYLERLPSLSYAQAWATEQLSAHLADTRPSAASLYHHSLWELVDQDPKLKSRFVGAWSQLWLWHNDPRRTRRQWPDLAVLVRASEVVTITGRRLSRLYAAGTFSGSRAILRGDGTTGGPLPRNSFLSAEIDGLVVCWDATHGTPPLVHSVRRTTSRTPAYRRLVGGAREPLPGCPAGLIVLGRWQTERPGIEEFAQLYPEYADAARAWSTVSAA